MKSRATKDTVYRVVAGFDASLVVMLNRLVSMCTVDKQRFLSFRHL